VPDVAENTTARVRAAAVAAVVVSLLGACTDHPGSAAVVRGQSISDARVSHYVDALCASAAVSRKAQGQPNPNVPVPYVRRFVLGYLVAFNLSDAYSAMHGLTVTDAAIGRLGGSSESQGLKEPQRSRVDSFIEKYQRYALQLSTIGSYLKDRTVTSIDKIDQATIKPGQAALESWAAKQSVTVDPSYGLYSGLTVHARSGSLSVAESKVARTWDKLGSSSTVLPDSTDLSFTLPENQKCG
jgi:hypothetical protein